MQRDYSGDTTEIDQEIAMLLGMKQSVDNGWLEVGRTDEGHLVYRLSAEGRHHVEHVMGKSDRNGG